LVGIPAPNVFEAITRFGSAVVNATEAIDSALSSADSPVDPAERVIAVVRVACDAFVKFLTIHPFVDGNGHTARALLWIILIRFGYVPDNWTIEPRPPFPGYGDSIAKHRRGDTAPLEQFVLRCISPAI
jgi:Fic family protein